MPNAAMPWADPSQTAPTAMPGVAPTATPGVAPTQSARPASRFSFRRSSQSMQSAQPMQSVQPNADSPQIIASGSTTPAGGGKKLSKGMIIGIVIIAILIIAAVVVGIVASVSSSNKSGNSSNSTSASVNIAFGDENTSEMKLSDGKTYTTEELLKLAPGSIFADAALKADAMLDTDSSAEKTKYFQNFDQLYQRLPNLANNYDINVDNIYEYYHDFSTVGYISPTSIMSRYKANGLEPTRNYIENAVTTNSNKNAIIEYAGYMREYDLAVLDLVNDVKINQGCDVEPKNPNNCNLSAAVSNDAYKEASANISGGGSAYQIRYNYQKAAIKTLLSIHELIYGTNEGNAE